MEKVSKVKCLVPFTQLQLRAYGYVYACCPYWSTLGYIDRLTGNKSIMDIWNNERIQYIRKCILENKLEYVCNYKYCPIAIKNEEIDLEEMQTTGLYPNEIIEQIKSGATRLETGPSTFEIGNSGKCNLDCIMCEIKEQYFREDEKLNEALYSKIIPELLPGLSRLTLSGNGDPLYNKDSRTLLEEMDPSRYPSLKLQLITNGLLFTRRMWDKIKHNNFAAINVSIDAATKTTYEYIRRNGKWDVLRRNLEFIRSLRQENVFYYFSISFVVMKSNYKEMGEFAELGLELGCDRVDFQKMSGLAEIRENINFIKDKKILAEIAYMLNENPVFRKKEIDTAAIDGYRSYGDTSYSDISRIAKDVTKALLYHPIHQVYKAVKYLPAIYFMHEFLGHKRVPSKCLAVSKKEQI
jgi:MoaA/NifB/PqqE/SkfB family radical SAM enzyme